MSALSYSRKSVVPMRTVLPSELLGSMRTSSKPSIDSNDPVDFFASGASSETASLRAVSFPEARIAVVWPQHSTSHLGAWYLQLEVCIVGDGHELRIA